MIPPKERESFSAINSKVNSIEQYLAAVDRDMNALAEEQDVREVLCSCGEKKKENGKMLESG